MRASVFRDNGDHTKQNMWSDGLTIHKSDGAVVEGCRFVDNSDVDLISGGGTSSSFKANFVQHNRQASFAGLMLDNFGGATSGDFTGAIVSGNTVLCGAQQCDFAVELGPHPWYLSPNVLGGTVTGNVVAGGKFNVNVEGGGTAQQPMVVTQNTIGPALSSATFNCGVRATTAFNVSPDSHVDVQGGPQATGAIAFHLCP